jgi:hypothetical protein
LHVCVVETEEDIFEGEAHTGHMATDEEHGRLNNNPTIENFIHSDVNDDEQGVFNDSQLIQHTAIVESEVSDEEQGDVSGDFTIDQSESSSA